MTFAEYYNKENKFNNHNILLENEIKRMPADVYADLMEHLRKNDGTIGVYVYHSHETNPETGELEFQGMKMGYYLRSWRWMYKLPIRDWFWRHRAVNGNQ